MPILLVKIMDWTACAQNYGYQIVNGQLSMKAIEKDAQIAACERRNCRTLCETGGCEK